MRVRVRGSPGIIRLECMMKRRVTGDKYGAVVCRAQNSRERLFLFDEERMGSHEELCLVILPYVHLPFHNVLLSSLAFKQEKLIEFSKDFYKPPSYCKR